MSTTSPASPEPFITVDDLARILGVPKSFVYEKSVRGEMPSFLVGRYRRYRLSEVLAWLEQQRQEAGDDDGR